MHSNEILSISLLQFFQSRVVKSSQLPGKIAAFLVSIGLLLCLAFLYKWLFFLKISLDWPLRSTTQLSTSKLFDNPAKAFLLRAIKAKDPTFYGFTSVIPPHGMLGEHKKSLFRVFSNIPSGLSCQ